jgi:hypothetical protein
MLPVHRSRVPTPLACTHCGQPTTLTDYEPHWFRVPECSSSALG